MEYAGARAAGAMVGQAILEKSVTPFLQEGEQALFVIEVRRMGPVMRWLFASLDVSPAGVELPKKMALVVSSARVLVLEARGALADEAKSLLLETPAAQVDSVDQRFKLPGTTVTWTMGGVQYTVATEKPKARRLVAALERARAAE